MTTYSQAEGSATFDGDINTVNTTSAGMHLDSDHTLVGETLTSFTAYFKKNNSNSTSQNFYCRILDTSLSVKATSGTSFDRADLSNSEYEAKTFSFGSGQSLADSDWIEFYADTNSNTDFILILFNDDDTHSGTWGHRKYVGTRSAYSISDLVMSAEYESSGGGSGGGGSGGGSSEGSAPSGEGSPNMEYAIQLNQVVPR